MNVPEKVRELIEAGAVEALDALLRTHPGGANEKITWVLNQKNQSDPLHYVSDCVFNGWLTNGREAQIAKVLLGHGAALDGSNNAESPLIGATSLSAEGVAQVLLDAGADVHRTSVFGANALHWAAFVGTPTTVERLLTRGAPLETRCTEFAATPLFWAVQGFSQFGPKEKAEQVAAATVLIAAGADVRTRNVEGVSAIARAQQSASQEMLELLQAHGAHESGKQQ